MIWLMACLMSVVMMGSAWGGPPSEVVGQAYARDGDDLVIDGKRIRLHGIDAFERNQICIKDGTVWPCGMEAWRNLQELVAGQQVRCVLAQANETRGRPVMRCYTGVLELNAEMVRLGLAVDCVRQNYCAPR